MNTTSWGNTVTDRYVAFTVVLEAPTRDDDAQATVDAIKQLKGVSEVVPVVADANTYWGKSTAKRELLSLLLDTLRAAD